jgi:hypothetical protein
MAVSACGLCYSALLGMGFLENASCGPSTGAKEAMMMMMMMMMMDQERCFA